MSTETPPGRPLTQPVDPAGGQPVEQTVGSRGDRTPPPMPKGHPKGFWFFFWGEFAERCSYYGMRAILAKYMVDKLGVDEGDAGTYMSLFIAACYFFPLIGGYIADNFLGKYWTIVLFSVPYVAAQFLVGVEDRYAVGVALLFLAMGSGVIKPNISTLMGLTYDQKRPGMDQLRTSAFSWFYLAINIGAALSQYAMPWLRTNYDYQTAFLFPAALMTLALLIFAAGKRYYAREQVTRRLAPGEPTPEARATVTGVAIEYRTLTDEEVAAERRLKLETLGRIGLVFLAAMFFWAVFDQTASLWVFFADTYLDRTLFGTSIEPDALQTFNPLFIIALVPVSVVLFKLYPVKATTKLVAGFLLTAASTAIMALAGSMAGESQKALRLTTPEGVLVLPAAGAPLDTLASDSPSAFGGGLKVAAPKFAYDKNNKTLSLVDGTITLSDGRTFAVEQGHLKNPPDADALLAGGVLEPVLKSGDAIAKVKPDPTKATLRVVEWTKPAERVTVWWEVLAYLILTVAEILISVTGLELAFAAAPQSMKSFVTACWLATVFLANILINVPVSQLYPLVRPGVYFGIMTVMMLVVAAAFVPVAARFNRGMASAPKVA